MLDFTRQSTLIPDGIGKMTVSIVGCGAVGSHLAEVLCKVGANNITIYDFDTVEAHNLPNQGFYLDDIGKKKVHAIRDRLNNGAGAQITAVDAVYDGAEFETHVVVSAVDSMAARKKIFTAWVRSPASKIFVDGRMGARLGRVFLVNKDVEGSVGDYAATLTTDEQAFQEPCTARATIFCAYGLAAFMCSALIGWVLREVQETELSVDFQSLAVYKKAA